MGLKRSIGPIGLMFSAVSGVLGSAWLFSPLYAAQHAGPASLIAWVVGWFAMLLIAMTFGELVTTFPVAGGNARYLHVTHGPLVGFAFSWLLWLGYSSVAPVETMGVLQYLSSLYPALTHQVHGVPLLTHVGYGIAAGVLLLMCWLNFYGIQWVVRYNSVMVWVKMIVPVIIAGFIMWAAFHASNFGSVAGFMPYGLGSVATTLSVGGVIFAFAGYAPAIVLAGEAKNPQRTVPLVLVGALTLCLIVYLLLQIALIGALPSGALDHGWAHAHYVGDTSPVLGLVSLLGLSSHLKDLIFVTAILAPLGTAFIFVATSSRVAYAMGQNGYFPGVFANVSRRGVPLLAVCLNFFVGILLFFPSPGWQGMVGFLVSAFVLCYGVGPIALLCLRAQAPDVPRAFKLPCAKLWCAGAFIIANLIVYWTGWGTVSKILMAIGLGFVVLLAMTLVRRRSWNIKHGAWILFYFVCLGFISYYGDFGGRGLFKAGWDEVSIVTMSIVVLWLAYLSKLKTCRIEDLVAKDIHEAHETHEA